MPMWFIDVPSLVIIIMPTIFFMAVTKTYRSVFGYFKNSFKSGCKFTEKELTHLSQDLGAIIKFVLASGVFAFIAGIIAMLANLNEPQTIGPSFAISLISCFYSVIISFFILYPTKVWAERNLREQGDFQ